MRLALAAPSYSLVRSEASMRGTGVLLWSGLWLPWLGRVNEDDPSIQKLGVHLLPRFLSLFYGGISHETEAL